MKEKLIIKNFGPIKDVELELGKFNVLIGEQATGKSTVAKLLAVCRYFSYIVPSDEKGLEWDGLNFSEGLEKWGLKQSIKEDTLINYECHHYSLKININASIIETEFGSTNILQPIIRLEPVSDEFKNLLNELESIKPIHPKSYWVIPSSFYENDVAAIIDNPFYLPTERGLQSIFSLGKDSTSNMSDPLFKYFVDVERIIRSFKSETEISPLKIQFKSIEGKNQVKKNNESSYFDLVNAASGYQSAIPIILVMKYYKEIRDKSKTFIIEEPELNLFPSAQAELIKFFAEQLQFHNGILLTTHSPYILTSLNNLMYAYQIGQSNKEETIKIIKEKYWVNPDDVSTYQLLPDGTCKNIIDESGLIMAEKIDVISRQINNEFDLMQDIKLGVESIND